MIGFIGLFDTVRDYTWQFTITHTHASVHSHVFTSRFSVTASNGGRSPSSGIPNCPMAQLPASQTNSSQRLYRSSPLTTSLTHQPTLYLLTHQLNQLSLLSLINCPAYNVSARTAHKTPFLCCYVVVALVSIRVSIIVVSHCCRGNMLYLQSRHLAKAVV
jgi:hypothetical protein